MFQSSGSLVLATEHATLARAGFAEIEMEMDRLEAQALEARLDLALGRQDEAWQLATEVWGHVCENCTAGVAVASHVYSCIADVLESVNAIETAPTSREVLEAGYRDMMLGADKIGDAELRRSYLENVAENRALADRWEKIAKLVGNEELLAPSRSELARRESDESLGHVTITDCVVERACGAGIARRFTRHAPRHSRCGHSRRRATPAGVASAGAAVMVGVERASRAGPPASPRRR